MGVLATLVVFDGEIGIVQHLWDQPIVEVVSLDGVIFVHCTDSLDHLKSKGRETQRERHNVDVISRGFVKSFSFRSFVSHVLNCT